jgi:hypothetical protein
MTKTEIINETVEYYGSHARAVDNGRCFYKTKDGKMCAVGRCLENPIEDCGSAFGLFTNGVIKDSSFKEQYKGHEPIFWGDLQYLHDKEHLWNTANDRNGLTPAGHEIVELLVQKWGGK